MPEQGYSQKITDYQPINFLTKDLPGARSMDGI